MKTKRQNLSGIYYRQLNTDTGKWENVCFEDLEFENQKQILDEMTKEQTVNLITHLVNVINSLVLETL